MNGIEYRKIMNTEIIQDFQLGNFDLLVILLYFAEYLWIDSIH